MSMCPICGGFDGHLATCPRTEYDDEERGCRDVQPRVLTTWVNVGHT
jgi:hypothetical protein